MFSTKTLSMIKKIEVYFGYNKITKEKNDLIEKETKFNLTDYRNKINN